MARYDLRVLATVFVVLPWCSYVAGEPSIGTRRTLGWLIDRSDEWAWLLIVSGAVALALSLTRWARTGWLVIAWAALVWVAFILLGLTLRQFTWNGLGGALLYLYFAHRAARGYVGP